MAYKIISVMFSFFIKLLDANISPSYT